VCREDTGESGEVGGRWGLVPDWKIGFNYWWHALRACECMRASGVVMAGPPLLWGLNIADARWACV